MGKWQALQDAIYDQQPVSGLTHNFYRYPARFAPSFARQAILSFTDPGDLVVDPFMGGGTTLVEALALGREALGTDISSLSVFLAKAKCTPISGKQLEELYYWGKSVVSQLNIRTARRGTTGPEEYQRNISCRKTWRIRKLLEIALWHVNELGTDKQKNFAKCVLLRTGQWALDCRETIPSTDAVRKIFIVFLEDMIAGARQLAAELRHRSSSAICLHRSAIGVEDDPAWRILAPPKLILTSPPYPGVHVLYHRWQILGRRETPAPFWIAGALDGHGASFYTLGGRHQAELRKYYANAQQAFSSLAHLATKRTFIVQMVAFSDVSWQLPAYLEMMESAGFVEWKIPELANGTDGRAWRSVPNRKWYADANGKTASSIEVVLFHKKRV